MPIPFACDDVPVIKRTRNARRRWLRRKRHRHRDNANTHGDKWSVGMSIPYTVSCDRRGGACCCVASSDMRTFRRSVGFTLCPHGLQARRCGPFPRVPHSPVDPGIGSRGNIKALPNSDEPERPHYDLFSSNPQTYCTLHVPLR